MSDTPFHFLVWARQTQFEAIEQSLLNDFSENALSCFSVLGFKALIIHGNSLFKLALFSTNMTTDRKSLTKYQNY